jgi:hypothetical protein
VPVVVQKNLWLVLQIFFVVGVCHLYSRGGDRNDQENQETIMEMPLLIQEKMLAGVDYQIRTVMKDFTLDGMVREAALADLCMAPWDVAAVFALPTSDPTSVIDRYGLKALTCADLHLCDPPRDAIALENEPWATDIAAFQSIPLFSPLDVWKACRLKGQGHNGTVPPPISCETDKLLRNIHRGYETVRQVEELANRAHDQDILETALDAGDLLAVVRQLETLIAEHSVWKTRDYLEAGAAVEYREQYLKTTLSHLRSVMEVRHPSRPSCVATWVSPSIIPLIEQDEEYQEATRRTKWLLYKAVTVRKGTLPEEEHNRMVAEAMDEDHFAKAYMDLIGGR